MRRASSLTPTSSAFDSWGPFPLKCTLVDITGKTKTGAGKDKVSQRHQNPPIAKIPGIADVLTP